MTAANQLAGYASSLPNFRNRIINGHLKSGKVINQRGASSITGATGYTFDRWYYDGSTYLYQGIEDANVQNGTYVISWEGSGISAAWKVSTDSTANNGPDATTGFTSVSNGGTFTVNETTEFSKHLWIQFSGTLSDLDKVQVELGTVATPFEHRPYGVEENLCYRYYYRMTADPVNVGGTTNAAYIGFAVGRAYSTTAGTAIIYLPVPLRTSPPVLNFTPVSGNNWDYNASNIQLVNRQNADKRAIAIFANIAVAQSQSSWLLSSGNLTSSTDSVFIDFSAEL